MLRRIGLAISYFIAILYILSILWPSYYCLRHGCKGPGELDAFMPAFALIPIGGIATAFCIAPRHPANQKKALMVLGFLACCNCFRDCSPRYIRLYRAPDLFHCISSAVVRILSSPSHSRCSGA